MKKCTLLLFCKYIWIIRRICSNKTNIIFLIKRDTFFENLHKKKHMEFTFVHNVLPGAMIKLTPNYWRVLLNNYNAFYFHVLLFKEKREQKWKRKQNEWKIPSLIEPLLKRMNFEWTFQAISLKTRANEKNVNTYSRHLLAKAIIRTRKILQERCAFCQVDGAISGGMSLYLIIKSKFSHCVCCMQPYIVRPLRLLSVVSMAHIYKACFSKAVKRNESQRKRPK